MGRKVEPERRPASEDAARRVERELEHGASEQDLDPADLERVGEATASPQPPPDERRGAPRGREASGTGQSAQVGGKPGDADQAERDRLTTKGPDAGEQARRSRVTTDPRDDDPRRLRATGRPASDHDG